VDERTDRVFKALGDSTRRRMLDRLRERQGLTLDELCADLGMARPVGHPAPRVLEAAGLVTSVQRGRDKLHYLSPVPLHDIQERWIDRFERPRLRAPAEIRRQAEEDDMADRPTYVDVTYIRAGSTDRARETRAVVTRRRHSAEPARPSAANASASRFGATVTHASSIAPATSSHGSERSKRTPIHPRWPT
jgi:DNA-binding transcriptional ArsR family regulator